MKGWGFELFAQLTKFIVIEQDIWVQTLNLMIIKNNYHKFIKRKMLTNTFRVLVNNTLKKTFIGKGKKIINILTAFFIYHKNNVKTFLKWIFNKYPNAIVSITLVKKIKDIKQIFSEFVQS